MSKGIVHARATVLLAAAGGIFTFTLGHPLLHAVALTGGIMSGLILTPDLDIDEGCISNDIVRRTLGRRAERVWALFWRPYGLMLPHRSRFSHMPILGTAVRLIYIAILPALVWWLANGLLASSALTNGAVGSGFATGILINGINLTAALTRPDLPAWSLWAVGGLVLADTLHYIMDRLF